MKDNFGKRMKLYESFETERRLMPLLPAVARMDGICFHSFCRGLDRPYDERLSNLMIELTLDLAKEFNASCAYTQSDEISLGWKIDNYESDMFCNGRILKLNSHLASKTSVRFNRLLPDFIPEKAKDEACFDARVMTLPNVVEAANMFLWREFDATRNSIQMAGQAYFSHKQLHKKNRSDIQEMLFSEKGINWNNYPEYFRRGTYILRKNKEYVLGNENLEKLPLKHNARTSSEMVKRKNIYERVSMPPFKKIINRERVLFYGEEPKLNENDKC